MSRKNISIQDAMKAATDTPVRPATTPSAVPGPPPSRGRRTEQPAKDQAAADTPVDHAESIQTPSSPSQSSQSALPVETGSEPKMVVMSLNLTIAQHELFKELSDGRVHRTTILEAVNNHISEIRQRLTPATVAPAEAIPVVEGRHRRVAGDFVRFGVRVYDTERNAVRGLAASCNVSMSVFAATAIEVASGAPSAA